MRLLAACVFVNVIACAMDPAPRNDVSQSTVDELATSAVSWDRASHGARDIWPADRGIATAEVAITADRAGDGSTVLATVSWNGELAAVYRVRAGADEAAFRRAAADSGAEVSLTGDVTPRSGSPVASPNPPPHPNV